MAQRKCTHCGGAMRVRSTELVIKVGRRVVKDSSARAPTCSRCGAAEFTEVARHRAEIAAAHVVFLEAADRAVAGPELRSARQAMGLTQAGLASALSVARATVARIERATTQPVSRTTRLAIATLLRLCLVDQPGLQRLAT